MFNRTIINILHEKINFNRLGFGDVFPSHARIILVNMFFIVMGVVR